MHDRLLARAHADGEEFQRVLVRYAIERFLYRLSGSAHSGAFRAAMPSNAVVSKSAKKRRRAARVSPSSGQVVEFAGGTPTAPTSTDAPLSPGYSGVAAVPVRLHPDSPAISAGDVVLLASLLTPAIDDVQVAKLGSTVDGHIFGIAAAASRGAGANRVVPVATTGVTLATIQSAQISANAPLTPVGATNVLRLANPGDVVVAHAARGFTDLDAPSTQLGPVWIVHPARVL